jgi:hypothetical protein
MYGTRHSGAAIGRTRNPQDVWVEVDSGQMLRIFRNDEVVMPVYQRVDVTRLSQRHSGAAIGGTRNPQDVWVEVDSG